MSTTNLFVELIVIGVGAAIWFTLFIFSMFGYHWVPISVLESTPAALPLLAIVYVLGIISDRIADVVFETFWVDGLRKSTFPNKKKYYEAQRLIITKSERLTDLMEYGRSRLRICRGWAFNSVLMAVSLNTFLWSKFYDAPSVSSISIFGTASLLLFSIAAWFVWSKLAKTQYLKIKEQGEFLANQKPE